MSDTRCGLFTKLKVADPVSCLYKDNNNNGRTSAQVVSCYFHKIQVDVSQC
jgi:hypothetical protein